MDKHKPQGSDIAGSPLFKKFVGKAEEYIKKPTRIKQLLNDAYEKASNKNDVGTMAHEAWESLQILFRLIKSSVSGEYNGLPTPTIVAAVAVVIYFLSPIDLIPDFIPLVGLLDDVALVAWFTSTLTGEMDKFKEWERTRPIAVSEPTDMKPGPATSLQTSDGTTANSGPKPGNSVRADEYAPEVGTSAQEVTESGKQSSTTDLGEATNSRSTDARPHADATANTTDGTRTRNDGAADTGGNVR